MEKYSHHLVIGNLLNTRKWEVVFVSKMEGEKWIRVPANRRTKSFSGVPSLVGSADLSATEKEAQEAHLQSLLETEHAVPKGEPAVEIESLIIPAIEQMHTKYIEQTQSRQTG